MTRIHARGIRTAAGQRKVLLINKFAEPVRIGLAGGGTAAVIDTRTGPPVTRPVTGEAIELDRSPQWSSPCAKPRTNLQHGHPSTARGR